MLPYDEICAPAMSVQLSESIPVANSLGECVLWDESRERLLWTDLTESRLHILNLETRETKAVAFDDYLCSFGLVEESDSLVCAFRTGIAIVDGGSFEKKWLFHLSTRSSVRLNDGRVDRQGRFWVGSLDDASTKSEGAAGQLYSLGHNGRVRSHLNDIRISNSICWSPDGRTMYFADSPKRMIHAFDFDCGSGELGARKVFARTPEGAFPDGSTVDAEGFLWNAEWGSGKVVRYAPDGRIDREIKLPVSQATCVAFGGESLSTLFVTTARIGLSDEALAAEPQAGNVFVYETSVRGLPEARFVDETGNDQPC